MPECSIRFIVWSPTKISWPSKTLEIYFFAISLFVSVVVVKWRELTDVSKSKNEDSGFELSLTETEDRWAWIEGTQQSSGKPQIYAIVLESIPVFKTPRICETSNRRLMRNGRLSLGRWSECEAEAGRAGRVVQRLGRPMKRPLRRSRVRSPLIPHVEQCPDWPAGLNNLHNNRLRSGLWDW